MADRIFKLPCKQFLIVCTGQSSPINQKVNFDGARGCMSQQ